MIFKKKSLELEFKSDHLIKSKCLKWIVKKYCQVIKNEKIKHFTDFCYKNKMKTYCVKCKKDTENIDPEIVKTRNGRLLMQSKCTICRSERIIE